MQDLVLTQNLLESSNGKALASALQMQQNLRHLDLSCCRITDEFCCALCPALRTVTTLTFLNLGGNHLRGESAQDLGAALVPLCLFSCYTI